MKQYLFILSIVGGFIISSSCTPQTTLTSDESIIHQSRVPQINHSQNENLGENERWVRPRIREVPRSVRPQREFSQEVFFKMTPPPEIQKVKLYPVKNPLKSFYRTLNNLSNGYPVNILHLGDSHTANDKFSGRLRQLFQRRFGSAGRGMLPMGVPFRYFRPNNVKVSQSGGWTVSNSFRAPKSGPYGLSGFRIRGSHPDQYITLNMTDGTRFDEIDIEFQRQLGSGTIIVEIDDDTRWEIATGADSKYVARSTIIVPRGGKRIKLLPKGDGPIELLSWTFKRDQAGVIYHSHGIGGTTINIINVWSRNVVLWEIGLLNPALIVVVYGTNEGFNHQLNLEKYARNFRERLALLRSAAPQASIIVVGPPDGNRLPRFCKNREQASCSPLTSDEMENYIQLQASQSQQLCRWHPPPKLHGVREIQREIAAQEGYVFWDWSEIMGGECGIHDWTQEDSASKDHVHLTERGYKASADALFKDIMAQFSSSRV